jgi:hypothetical protein
MFEVMLSVLMVLGGALAENVWTPSASPCVVNAELIRENAVAIPKDIRNRMTSDCNGKFIRSGQPAASRKGYMSDCKSESIKSSRQAGEGTAPAKQAFVKNARPAAFRTALASRPRDGNN